MVTVAAVVLGACTAQSTVNQGSEPAVEFPDSLVWFNTNEQPVKLDDLSGKAVLIHFWSAGCADCLHSLADLERLQALYPEEITVIGVHVPRFPHEAAPIVVLQAVLRHRITYPVVSDPQLLVRQLWGVEAQPTVVVVDPAGNVVGARVGDGVYEALEPVVRSLLDDFADVVDDGTIPTSFEGAGMPNTVLSFPSGIAADPAGRLVFVADTAHNRILAVSLPSGEVSAVFGSGEGALRDGVDSAFHDPQGLDLSDDGSTLYVADTGNHAVRAIEVATGAVTTVAGTGELGQWPPRGGPAAEVALRSPWDVAVVEDIVYVSMAGSHQIWALDLDAGMAEPLVGSGSEGVVDGPGEAAELTRPGGLAAADGHLWFTDPESSTIRMVDLETRAVVTVAGAGQELFDSGDVDGVGELARFEFPLGLSSSGSDELLVADTYNSKLKLVDVETGNVTSLVGGDAGWQDGPDPRFARPFAIDVVDRTAYVADTDNHALRLVDLDSGDTTTVVIIGSETFAPPPDDEDFEGMVIEMASAEVAAGPGSAVLDISLPTGHKVNEQAPSSLMWLVDGAVAELSDDNVGLTGATFPVSYPVDFLTGSGTLTADVNLFWCAEGAEGLCFIERLRLIAPVVVGQSDNREVKLSHEIELPPSS